MNDTVRFERSHDVEEMEGVCRYTRTIINPARPKPPPEEMIRRIDEEATASLRNIKTNVEKRRGKKVVPIVAERAKKYYTLGFLEYFRFGAVSTVLVSMAGVMVIYLMMIRP